MLGRDTDWKQGCILDQHDSITLGLIEQHETSKYAVVISHDCDLPNEREEEVEVIVGIAISKADSMFTNARNPRLLHLNFSSEKSGKSECIELSHSQRRTIKKSEFENFSPNRYLKLETNEKHVLKQWLASRYGRPAFPNSFEARLRKKHRNKPVEVHFGTILKPVSKHLIGVFFDLGDELTSELQPNEPYFLRIYLAYDATEGGQEARETAETTAEKINDLFLKAYGTENPGIVLENCDAIADTQMTLADLRKVAQWRVEYMSLRSDPPDPYLAIGG